MVYFLEEQDSEFVIFGSDVLKDFPFLDEMAQVIISYGVHISHKLLLKVVF